jgi:GT2 family glycosyltransferase
VGRFDEGFDPAWHEDNDYHRRIRLSGCEAGALAPYWHFRNGTIRTDPSRRAAALNGGFDRSRSYYARKWGAPDDGQSPLGRETLAEPRFGPGIRAAVTA